MNNNFQDTSLYFEGLNPYIKLNYNTLHSLVNGELVENSYDLYPNQIYIASDQYHSIQPIPLKISSDNMISKYNLESHYGDIQASDLFQKIALDLMNDPKIPLVTCLGSAGTGKSSCAIMSALKMLQNRTFDKVYFIKPMVGVSKSKFLGALKGGLEEKCSPFLASFQDVAYSWGMEQELERYLANDTIEFVPVDFIRGRTLEDALVLCEEAHNLDRHDFIAVISRLGKDSRMFIMGDPAPLQNDIRKESGLVSFISSSKFWNSRYTSCIHLKKRMRNPIVELAEDIIFNS